jgi:hypothetical protein
MLKIPFWPERTWSSRARLAVLMIVLLLMAELYRELSEFDPGSVYFHTLTRLLGASPASGVLQGSRSDPARINTGDPNYGFSALDQARISLACERFFQRHRSIPVSLDELKEEGLSPVFYLDPWKRRYKTRLLPGEVLMVQTTGPSGVDAISREWVASADQHLKPAIQLVGDNQVLLMKLKRADEGQVTSGKERNR